MQFSNNYQYPQTPADVVLQERALRNENKYLQQSMTKKLAETRKQEDFLRRKITGRINKETLRATFFPIYSGVKMNRAGSLKWYEKAGNIILDHSATVSYLGYLYGKDAYKKYRDKYIKKYNLNLLKDKDQKGNTNSSLQAISAHDPFVSSSRFFVHQNSPNSNRN